MKRLAALLFLLFVFTLPSQVAHTQFNGCKPGFCIAGSTDNPTCPTSNSQANAFIARTSGLDVTHTCAYKVLIKGLVDDGVFAKLDVLYVWATQNSTTALLNLVSTNFNGTAHQLGGPLIFTADQGFQSADGGTTGYIDTGFNPSTATTPNYTQNSAHLSAWSNTKSWNDHFYDAGGDTASIFTVFSFRATGSGGQIHATINDGTGFTAASPNSGAGFICLTRTASNARVLYSNNISLASDATASTGVPNLNFYAVGSNNNGTPSASPMQQLSYSIGGGLNSTDEGNLYARLHTYMLAVGVTIL